MVSDVIVYSAVTSGYDMVFKPKTSSENIHYVLFSDRVNKIRGWDVLPLTNKVEGSHPLTNRWYKFFPHKVFREAEYSVYVDGNIRILGDLAPLIEEFKQSRAALGLFKHLERTTILQEVDACLEHRKFDERDKEQVKYQLQTYAEEGMPLDQPLTDNGIIFRWHKHPGLSKAMSSWWGQLHEYSKRDQISLPYVVWKEDVSVKRWDWSFRESNAYFEAYPHRHSLIGDLYTVIFVFRNDYRLLGVIYKWISEVRNYFK